MDRMPQELLLHIFKGFSFNELRSVAATCSRWLALSEGCRGFWSDIQTPLSPATRCDPMPERTTASALALRRIERTRGRAFALRLRGLYPGILEAVAQHARHIEHLEVDFFWQRELDDLALAMRTVLVPRLRRLTLQSTAFPTSKPLPADLFGGVESSSLQFLCLRNVALPESAPLPCFSSVVNLRYWPTDDFFEPIPEDLFAHFPSMRTLSLAGQADASFQAPLPEELPALRRFQTANYTTLERLELFDDSYTLASNASWPLEIIPHIVVDSLSDCRAFPFLPSHRLQSPHLVFEVAGNHAWIRLGNHDWTFSRSCTIFAWDPASADDSAIRTFHADEDLDTTNVQSVTVAAVLWPRCWRILWEVYNLSTIRIVLKNDVLPAPGRASSGGIWRVPAPDLERLVFRGEPASAGPVRIPHEALTEFAEEQFDNVEYCPRLCLENVELTGEPDDDFEASFDGVETWDADAWSYLSMRKLDPWQDI